MSFEALRGDYDFVVSGTGTTECLISGALAQASKKGIHFDREKEYGGCRQTKGIQEFLEWAKKSGTIIVDKMSEMDPPPRNGSYGLDLMPFSFFARDEMIQVFRDAQMTDALSFFLVDGMYFMGKYGWRSIPVTRGAIFRDS